MQPIPNTTYGDPRFYGLSTADNPVNVESGFVTVADNVSVEAGQLVSRPGKQGAFASALGSALYNPTPVKRSDGTTRVWFAQGTGLYQFNPASGTSATAITYGGMPALTAANVSICQAGGYVYVTDASSTGLLRFGADGTAGQAYTGLTKPAKPTSVSLTNRPFIPNPGSVTWESVNVSTVANLITAGNETPTAANTNYNTGGKFWRSYSPGIPGDIDFTVFDGTAVPCVVLGGTVGASIKTQALALSADADGDYPAIFDVQFTARTKTNAGAPTSRIKVILHLYSDTACTTFLEDRTGHVGLMSYTLTNKRITFDCRDLSSKPHGVVIEFQNDNDGVSGDDPQMGVISLRTGGTAFDFADSSGTLQVKSGAVYAQPEGNACSGITGGSDDALITPEPQGLKLFTADRDFYYDFSGAQNLSQVNALSAVIRFAYTNVPDGTVIPVQMFVENAGNNREYGDVLNLSPGVTETATFDLTAIDSTIRGAVTRFGVRFLTDIPTSTYAGDYAATPSASPVLLEITSITQPGNLTVGTSVYYRIEEWDTSGDNTNLVNVIISDGSGVSGSIEPTQTNAVGVITLPARTNSNAGYFAVYRFGDFVDGYGRLVGLFPFTTTDLAYGADTAKGLAAPANPYIAIDYPVSTGGAGTIVTDNTPSIWLEDADIYVGGRQAPPTNIVDMAFHMNRLWLLTDEGNGKSGLYASWLIYGDKNAGLYFTRVPASNDPNAETKGYYSGVGNDNNDKAKRIFPLYDRLVILFGQRVPAMLTGDSPLSFSIRDYTNTNTGLGLVAKRAAMVFGNALWFLTSTGLVRFVPEGVTVNASVPIRGLLNPDINGTGTALTASAYKECALWQSGGRIYLAAPKVAADSANTCIYRFDPREGSSTGASVGDDLAGSWTRWLQGNVTGGCSLTGEADTNNHIVSGLDGMLYRYINGEGDKATSGASVTAILVTTNTRRYGQADGSSEQFRKKESVNFSALVQADAAEPAGVVVTFGINGEAGGNAWSQAWTLADNSEIQKIFTKSARGIEGQSLQMTLSASVTKRFVVHSLGMQAKVGSDR